MCVKNIYTSTSYILVSWFFLQNIFEKTVFPFYALFGGKIGSYQGRIRAVSEPYQSRIRAKLKIFHFFWGIGFFFCFSRCSALFLLACHEGSKKKHMPLPNAKQFSAIQICLSIPGFVQTRFFWLAKKHQWFDQYFVQLLLHWQVNFHPYFIQDCLQPKGWFSPVGQRKSNDKCICCPC